MAPSRHFPAFGFPHPPRSVTNPTQELGVGRENNKEQLGGDEPCAVVIYSVTSVTSVATGPFSPRPVRMGLPSTVSPARIRVPVDKSFLPL